MGNNFIFEAIMGIKRNYFFLLLCSLYLVKGAAQSFNFKNYSVEDGLPYVQIYDVYQDDKGYLWTGGYGGLSSFDGLNFTSYNPRKGLINYWVKSIVQDSSKNLIIGTKEGLSVFDRKKFTNYPPPHGLPDNYINSVSTKGAETAIATRSGLCYLKKGQVRSDSRLAGQNLLRVKAVNDGYLISCLKKIYFVKLNQIQLLCSFQEESDTAITFFDSDRNANLWIATNKGLFCLPNYDIQKQTQSPQATEIKDHINTLYADYKNVLWIGMHSTLLKYFNGKITSYPISSDTNANTIYCLTADYEQNIWIGTRSGLFKFRDEGFVYYGKESELKSLFIQSIVLDKDKKIWIATSGGGVYERKDDHFKNYDIKNGLPDNTTSALAVDQMNRVWIGTDKGLCYQANNQIIRSAFLKEEFIHFLFIDHKGNLWAGLKDKVACIENIYGYPNVTVKYYVLPIPNGIAEYQLSSMCEDEQGKLYIASFLGGLFLIDGTKISDITKEYGLQTRAVVDVKVSASQYVFVATLDGIYIINQATKRIEKITEEDGLSSNLVYSLLLTDHEQTLWAGTNQGANKIDLQSFFQSHVKNVLSFGITEGFKGLECNTGGLCMDSTGSIWFSTVNGLVRHNPGKYLNNDNEARLTFTGFKLFYNDTLLEPFTRLSNDMNNIRFGFIGICLTNPEKVQYIHKLEGFENSWSPPSKQTNVNYSNLPPGSYIFKVRCCNNQGMWSTEPLMFSFSVAPPFWQHWWFFVIVLISIGLIIYTIFRIRLNQFKKEQEKESKMQIEIAKNELKALRAQMNPHFLFNSLNSIQHYILNNKAEEAVFYLNRFAKLMRMILNNSEKTAITLNEEINALRIYIDLERMRFSNLFEYEIIVADSLDADYEQIPSMLLQPYVENAILHGLVPKGSNGMLQIHFFVKDHYIHATITDNGIGRKKAAEMKNQSRKNHVSLGTKITNDRLRLLSHVQQLSYNIKYSDLENPDGSSAGTRVEIVWPLM